MNYVKKLSRNFVRVHRSYVANLDHVHIIEGNTIYFDKKHIPIGNKNRAVLMKAIDII